MTAAEPTTFSVMQQFVVSPDRRCQVEVLPGRLRFTVTGSEFDAQWLSRGMGQHFGDKAAGWAARASPNKILAAGLTVTAVSIGLLVVIIVLSADANTPVRKKGTGLAALTFGIVVGLVMIVAGVLGRASSVRPYSVGLTDISGAELLPAQSELQRRGEPQVARVRVHLRDGKPMMLALPTDADLAALRSALPMLPPG